MPAGRWRRSEIGRGQMGEIPMWDVACLRGGGESGADRTVYASHTALLRDKQG